MKVVGALAALAVAAVAAAGTPPRTDLPAAIDPKAQYLFYLHGRILELQGRSAVSPDFGRYEYDAILQALAEPGFVVISELRSAEAGSSYAQRVADQVRQLRRAGVPGRQIGIVGASKGGWLALLAAAELGDPEVGFVILAGCNPSTPALGPRLRGRILAIRDDPDRFAPSCAETFRSAPKLTSHQELVLHLGLDHGLLYRPRREWLDPTLRWLQAPR